MLQDKQTKIKKSISVFLVLVLVMVTSLYFLPADNVFAEDSTKVITFLSGSSDNGTLTREAVEKKLSDEGLDSDGAFTAVFDGNVNTIGSMAFTDCTGLTSFEIPSGVTNIGVMAFSGCTGLTEVTIPSGVTSIGDAAFSRCTGLTAINIDENNSNYSSDNGVVFNNLKTTLVVCPAGKSSCIIPDSATSIGDNAFFGCAKLTYIKIPDSVLDIGSTAFAFCSSLSNVDLGNRLEKIGDAAFGSCGSLVSIVIPDSVTSIGYGAFHSCTSLTNVDIGYGVEAIGYNAFLSTQIKTITLPPSVQTFGFYGNDGVFSHMPVLENIVFEGDVIDKEIPANTFLNIYKPIDSITPINIYIPKNIRKISDACRLDQNTQVYAFAESIAEGYAITKGIPYVTMPTILAEEREAPPGYQYIPYSLTFKSSVDSWLITKPGIDWPDGLNIAVYPNEKEKRVHGEIYGAPKEWGKYNIAIEATDGNNYLLKDEITFTIDVEPYLEQSDLEEIINKNRRIRTPLGVYIREKDIYIVDVYTKDPEDKEIVFDCDFDDFIALWIDGMLMKRDLNPQAKNDPQVREGDYYAENGSTRITVYGQTFSELIRLDPDPNKDHVIAAEFKADGAADGEHYTVAQNFRINLVDRPEPTKPRLGSSGGTGSIPAQQEVKTVGDVDPPGVSEPQPEIPDLPFLDVKDTDWFAQDVIWVYQRGIMKGVSDTEFAPYTVINSAMMMTALTRMLNVDMNAYSAVVDDKWYSRAIAWGKDIGLFYKIDEQNFDISLERGQVAIILSMLLRGAGVDAAINEEAFIFFDIELMSDEALDAFKLLNTLGIMKGKGNGMMDPLGVTTRAELAAILHRVDVYIDKLAGRYGTGINV